MYSLSTIPYSATQRSSALVLDYVQQDAIFKNMISFFPEIENIEKAIAQKKKHTINRTVLVDVIRNQYQDGKVNNMPKEVDLLLEDNTFTICTAHQPLIFTGHLYFIYKILHTISACIACKNKYPKYNFVPIFYIGSEDNDIDEIGELHLGTQAYQWKPNENGACGKMSTESLHAILQEVKKYLNIAVDDEHTLIQLFETAYNTSLNLSQATRWVVHTLFQKYGVVVLDADDIRLKKQFLPILKKELWEEFSYKKVTEQINELKKKYTTQAAPRPINLFYMVDGIRERIIKVGANKWEVHNTSFSFSSIDLEKEVELHPEHFSPNVILRPLYQEIILPNICYIGGGGELAYWMQLKWMFDAVNVCFPIVMLRNSFSVLSPKVCNKIDKWKLTMEQLFWSKNELWKLLLKNNKTISDWEKAQAIHENIFELIEPDFKSISPNLLNSVTAHKKKIENIMQRIEQKILAHIKKQEIVLNDDLNLIGNELFPNEKLQERHFTLIDLVKRTDLSILDFIITHQDPFNAFYSIIKPFS